MSRTSYRGNKGKMRLGGGVNVTTPTAQGLLAAGLRDAKRTDDAIAEGAQLQFCPKCENPMVVKVSQYGQFWSCRRYPVCKGTRKMT